MADNVNKLISWFKRLQLFFPENQGPHLERKRKLGIQPFKALETSYNNEKIILREKRNGSRVCDKKYKTSLWTLVSYSRYSHSVYDKR